MSFSRSRAPSEVLCHLPEIGGKSTASGGLIPRMMLLPRPLLAFVLLASAVLAAELPGPTGVQPLPGVVQCAKAHGIPLEGFELASNAEEACAGDRITVLFTIQEGRNERQWLAEFRSAALTDREAESKPGSGLGLLSVFQSSLKTDTGHEYSFVQSPAALAKHGRERRPDGGLDVKDARQAADRAHVLRPPRQSVIDRPPHARAAEPADQGMS